jgi:hypothetical protein
MPVEDDRLAEAGTRTRRDDACTSEYPQLPPLRLQTTCVEALHLWGLTEGDPIRPLDSALLQWQLPRCNGHGI